MPVVSSMYLLGAMRILTPQPLQNHIAGFCKWLNYMMSITAKSLICVKRMIFFFSTRRMIVYFLIMAMNCIRMDLRKMTIVN